MVMGRDTPYGFGQQFTGRRSTEVTQTEYADHSFVLVYNWQSADLNCLHVTHRLGEIIVLAATMNAGGHHIARSSAKGIETVLRQTFANDVTVSHHADQSVVLSNRNGTDIVFTH